MAKRGPALPLRLARLPLPLPQAARGPGPNATDNRGWLPGTAPRNHHVAVSRLAGAPMRQRHTYAATDNIVLDMRLGPHLMGDEVRAARPKLDVVVLGTNLVEKAEVVRGGAVVHTERPAAPAAELRFAWEDPMPRRGEKATPYYVRVKQKDGQMAWSSPLWVTVGN